MLVFLLAFIWADLCNGHVLHKAHAHSVDQQTGLKQMMDALEGSSVLEKIISEAVARQVEVKVKHLVAESEKLQNEKLLQLREECGLLAGTFSGEQTLVNAKHAPSRVEKTVMLQKWDAHDANNVDEAGTAVLSEPFGKARGRGYSAVTSAKYPIILGAHEMLESIFGKNAEIWWMDWKLWVGLAVWTAVWVKWIKFGYEETYREQFPFAFAINILILHYLQYANSIREGMLLVNALLFGQTLFHNYLWYLADGSPSCNEFDCETLYLDFVLPSFQIAMLFVAQVFVWWFYMSSIINNFDLAHVNYLFWMVAFLAMQMTMIFCRGADSVLGKPFPIHDVLRMVNDSSKLTYAIQDVSGGALSARYRHGVTPFQVSKAELLMRGLMGFFCNSILREIMSYTIPLMLMGFAEPMDFVVYCVGVNFICTLDDMSTRRYLLKEVASTKGTADPEMLADEPTDPEAEPQAGEGTDSQTATPLAPVRKGLRRAGSSIR